MNKIPTTEGIKYTGSKLKLLPEITKLIEKTDSDTIIDCFSGTTRVSQALSKLGYRVICNDQAIWSYHFGNCYLLNKSNLEYYQKLVSYLNSLPSKDGWFTKHYGGISNFSFSIQKDGLKKPFQIHNTRKLDAIREEIDNLDIDFVTKSVLITSLVLALDKVDSTLGHFSSYLNKWSKRSYNNLHLKVPNTFISNRDNIVFNDDIFNLLPNLKGDLAYIDPPYGSNNEKMPSSRVRYASYYHFWRSVCLFDKPTLFGKAKRPTDTSDKVCESPFESFQRNEEGDFIALRAIEDLIERLNVKWILLSYSSGGRATASDLDKILRKQGKIKEIIKLDYKKNVMSNFSSTGEWLKDSDQSHQEFLFLLRKFNK